MAAVVGGEVFKAGNSVQGCVLRPCPFMEGVRLVLPSVS